MQISVTDNFALKLILLRAGILSTSNCELSRVHVDCYRYTLALVSMISTVFIFIFYFVYPV